MSSIDALTGIFNRRAFFERAVEAIERPGPGGGPHLQFK